MAQKNYGLGFSPLSMSNAKTYGFNEEFVSNKNVGMFGIIADDTKRIVSQEYLIRCKHQLDNFVSRLMQDNTLGRIYKICINEEEKATIIKDNSTNLVFNSTIKVDCGSKAIKGVRFNFDIDIFGKTNASPLVHFNDATIDIEIMMNKGTASKRVTISSPLLSINSTAYALSYEGIDSGVGNTELTISSIIIKPGTSFDYSAYQMTLYDILFEVI